MEIKLLKSEEDYQKALERTNTIFHAKPDSKEQEELEMLVMLIEKYEDDSLPESCRLKTR